ncbi:MAG: hypothetical protein ACTSQO_13455 [Candidatus Helarchaeota archaeon]
MVPKKCLEKVNYEEDRAVIYIDKCLCKRIFVKNLKKYKLDDKILNTAFCEFNCISTFQSYGQIGDITVSGIFKEKGCTITTIIP